MARYDKYDPISGGTRAVLDVALATEDLDTVIGVGLTANGRVVKGDGNTGIIGVLVNTRKSNNAGDVVDIMRSGDIVETGLAAGTVISSAATGVVAAGTTGVYVGHTVEAGRLVVALQKGVVA